MKHPTKEELTQFVADCNRDGICRLDMESAVRNHVMPTMYSLEDSLSALIGN